MLEISPLHRTVVIRGDNGRLSGPTRTSLTNLASRSRREAFSCGVILETFLARADEVIE